MSLADHAFSASQVLDGPDPCPGGETQLDDLRGALTIRGQDWENSRQNYLASYERLQDEVSATAESVRTVISSMLVAQTAALSEAATAGAHAIRECQDARSQICAKAASLRTEVDAELAALEHVAAELALRGFTLSRWDAPPHWTGSLGPDTAGAPPWVARCLAVQTRLRKLQSQWRHLHAQRQHIDAHTRARLEALLPDARTAAAGAHPSPAADLTALLASLPSPASVAQLWSALPEAARTRLIAMCPEQIGNLPGIPYRDRHRANTRVLESALAEARAQEQSWDASATWLTRITTPSERPNPWTMRVTVLERLWQDFVSSPGAAADPPRFLISFSDDPERSEIAPPRVAIAFGDLDSARTVATIVQGMNSSSEHYRQSAATAVELYHSVGDIVDDQAVVLWMDYTSPTTLEEPLLDRAEAGASRLGEFLDTVAATRSAGEPVRHTLIAHSYGTAVAALALHDSPRQVDNLVLLGSAGLPARVSDTAELAADRVFAMASPDDYVALLGQSVGSHPVNPNNPYFGATVPRAADSSGHALFPAVSSENVPLDEVNILPGETALLTPETGGSKATQAYLAVVDIVAANPDAQWLEQCLAPPQLYD